jgi:hypothetical protein
MELVLAFQGSIFYGLGREEFPSTASQYGCCLLAGTTILWGDHRQPKLLALSLRG